MKRFFQSELGATVLWVLCSLAAAAAITPWVYQAGKQLAGTAAAQDLSAFLEWLGAACGRAKFGRFFDRSLMFSALVLLPVLLGRIRMLRFASGAARSETGPRHSGLSAAAQIGVGCIIAGGALWAMGALLETAGACVPAGHVPAVGKLFWKILMPAVAVSVLEECLFRGLLLGLWLRFARPAAACLGTSLVFGFLHFLQPPSGTVIADPTHVGAGFQLVGKILLHFTDPRFFVTDFATLVAAGLILAWSRVRTGALWFPIGLHAGWIMVFKGFNLFYEMVPGHPLRPWGVGDGMRSGVLPLLTLGTTAVICHFALRRFEAARPHG